VGAKQVCKVSSPSVWSAPSNRHRTCFSQIVGAVLASVFVIFLRDFVRFPSLPSQHLPSTWQTATKNMNHHHAAQD
jgi:hypothetical protein